MVVQAGIAATAAKKAVTIKVNKSAVSVTGPRLTGLEIKQAAIDQGVPIGLDFVLSQLRPNRRPMRKAAAIGQLSGIRATRRAHTSEPPSK